MKYILFLSLFLCVSSYAEDLETRSKTVYCKPTKELIEELIVEHKENPEWFGADTVGESKYVLMHNPNAKSWTFIQFNDSDACILGFGINVEKEKT
jgi:hypothetical protein